MDDTTKVILVMVTIIGLFLIIGARMVCVHVQTMADKGFCQTTIAGHSDTVWAKCSDITR